MAEPKNLKIVMISDTHNSHCEIGEVPAGDILIHAGDAADEGSEEELRDFFEWFAALPHPDKVYVPGNHDGLFAKDLGKAMSLVPAGVTILIGSEDYLPVSGLSVFGAPWTPWNAGLEGTNYGAFALRDEERANWWEKLVGYVDIIVSHAPPVSIAGIYGDGLVDDTIAKHKPRLLVCGHIHRYRGVKTVKHASGEITTIINAASMDEVFIPCPPTIYDFEV